MLKALKQKCAAFGIGYFGDDSECGDCDVSKLCRKETNKLNKKTEDNGKMSLKKLLKKAKGLKTLKDLKKFVEDEELDVEIKKGAKVAAILTKIEAALEEKFAEPDEDEDDDDTGDDEDTGDDDDDDDSDDDEDSDDDDDDDDDDDTGDDDDDDDDDDDTGDDDDDDEEDTVDAAELEERVKALETRFAELEEKMNQVAAAPPKKKKGAKKEEKEALKQELLKGVPYSDKDLKKLGGKKLKSLASALGINSFGKKTDQVLKMIVKAQKSKGKKKPSGKKKK